MGFIRLEQQALNKAYDLVTARFGFTFVKPRISDSNKYRDKYVTPTKLSDLLVLPPKMIYFDVSENALDAHY